MRVIDAHVHLYPPEVGRDPAAWAAEQREDHWAVLCARKRKSGQPVQSFPTLEELLRAMDAGGVERSVLLGWYWQQPETCAWQNRFFAECVRAHPDRLDAFAAVHPAAGVDAVRAEMRRARDDGLCGLGELSPHSQGIALADPALNAAIGLAADFGWPVNLHVADPSARRHPGWIETPLDALVLWLSGFPLVRFVLAHWGGGLALREGDPARRAQLAHVVYDTAASPLIYDAAVWKRALEILPPEKVVFGSDYPLNLYPKTDRAPGWTGILAEVAAAGLDSHELEAVLAGNAARLLRR
jgi:uncharacterized protein